MIFVGERYADLFEALRAELPSLAHHRRHRDRATRAGYATRAPRRTQEEVEEADVEETRRHDPHVHQRDDVPAEGRDAQLRRLHRLRHEQHRARRRHARGTALLSRAALPHRRRHQHDDDAVDRPPARGPAAVRGAAWLEPVERERVTHAFVVPTMMKQLLDQPDLEQHDLSSSESLVRRRADAVPGDPPRDRAVPEDVGFVNAFGQTETTSTLTVLGPDDHRLEGTRERSRKLRRLRSIGRPLPDVEVRVVDDDGNALPAGRGRRDPDPHAARDEGLRAESGAAISLLEGGWLPTRDMGWIDEDGYIYLAGRKDDMIIRGGENIAPAEVEAVLQCHPAVEEVAVVGVPTTSGGSASPPWSCSGATGALLGAGRARRVLPAAAGELQEARDDLAFSPELPKNPLGKVLKKDLQAAIRRRDAPRRSRAVDVRPGAGISPRWFWTSATSGGRFTARVRRGVLGGLHALRRGRDLGHVVRSGGARSLSRPRRPVAERGRGSQARTSSPRSRGAPAGCGVAARRAPRPKASSSLSPPTSASSSRAPVRDAASRARRACRALVGPSACHDSSGWSARCGCCSSASRSRARQAVEWGLAAAARIAQRPIARARRARGDASRAWPARAALC